jgi:hypothetical protein
MATISANNPMAHEIYGKLRRAWHKERRFVHTRGLCSLLLWAVAMLLVDLLIDWLFLMPGVGRVALLVTNLAVLGAVVHRNWLRHLRAFDPVRVALQVEGRHPELKNLLVSYVQLREVPADGNEMSPTLLAAFRGQAIEKSTPINFKEIVNYRELKRLLAVSLAAIAIFGLVSIRWSDFLNTLLYRMLVPGTSKSYPTRVNLDQVSGDLHIKYGEEAVIFAQCSGQIPKEGTLRIKTALSKNWDELPLPQEGNGRYSHKFDGVFQDFLYELKVGDARSKSFKVTVIPPPRIAKSRIALKYPAYTGLENKEVADLNLQVPEGTEITWRLTFDMQLQYAFLIRDLPDSAVVDATTSPASQPTSQPISLKLEDDGKTAVYKITASESFPYRFRWIEQKYGYAYSDDVRYVLSVEPDTPPIIDILYPTADGKATVNKTLTVKFRADDNYGLSQLFVVYSLNDDAEKRVPLEKLSGKTVEREINWAIKNALPDIKEGDTLTWSLEVADNHNGTPLLGRSRSFRLSIVSQAEYLRYVFEEHARLMKEVEAMQQDETTADKSVETIKNSPTSMPASAP